MNQMLCEPYSEVEVLQAISHMSPYKSPGPDGLPPIFFHKFWHLIESVSQFRPISLCNVIIRIASKCVANRIKPFMNSTISDSQSAFIPGRLITDNILVAYELNHFLKSKTGGQKGFAAIKLDMSKAYDRVEWPFLESMLSRLEAENSNSVKGVKIARNVPCISHLLFADDTLVFCEASLSAMQEVSRLLSKYEAASSQKVNLEKLSMVLSRNVEQFDRVLYAEALGVKVIEKHDKYLGLPAVGGRSKREMFDGIREKIWKCIQGWNSKLLNQVGKQVNTELIRLLGVECVNEKALEVWGSDISRTLMMLCLPSKHGVLFNIQSLQSAKFSKPNTFHHFDFFHAGLGGHPSLTWRSVLGSRELIVAGSWWRVGNGKSINVRKDMAT
ncbi:hypothetical protein Sango_2435700 [Sesamum angolense]|uniref:Reverse transcriptase domain-containing protein n=1 Tax=Sesamum angolense TaxID=2727404 RepID=A0AAE1W7Q1_9LAMI|nr:hypothetical protein Sango_2435700 [Sesamum angolense]